MRILTISLAAVAALAFSSSFATTQARVTGNPPHASTTGLHNRSPVASMHGANQRHFCPPGQHKKPGMGSAFHC
jgi:hypothetical protein